MDGLEQDRFDLEEALAACWNTQDDLNILYEEILEGDSSSEDIANAMLGLSRLHGMRCAKAMRILEELIHEGKID